MEDYLNIGQILDLNKYDKFNFKLRDLDNKNFYILKIKAIKNNDNEGFQLTIETEEHEVHTVSTYSAVIKQQLIDILLQVENTDGVLKIPIKCKLNISPYKNKKSGQYFSRFKLV